MSVLQDKKNDLFGIDSFTHSTNPELQYYLIAELLDNFNFRISEVLRLNESCLIPPNFILVVLSKTNDKVVISSNEFFIKLKHYFALSANHGFTTNYIRFYRWFLRRYPERIVRIAGKNRKVTHYARYRNANIINSVIQDEKFIQNLLRHRSKTAQKYYVKDSR